MSEMNPHRLYRNKREGRFLGVCAGVADYFDFRVGFVRLFTFFALFMIPHIVIPAYLLAGFALKDKPERLREDPVMDRFQCEVLVSPRTTLVSLKRRFFDIEQRLRKMEARVTSKEFSFDHHLDA